MPTSSVMTVDERRRDHALPLWDVPGWRERFGIVAGITGRGDNAVPFDLGLWGSAPVGDVMSRWRAFRQSMPEFGAHILAHQVHRADVLWHEQASGWVIHEGFDGHATGTPGLLLLVTVADCVPVYLVAPERRVIAMLHAGWRGAAAGILRRGVELLHRRAGVDPSELVMHAGVAISGPCYEVGREVVEGLGGVVSGDGPWQIDIRDRLVEQAHLLGVGEVSRSSRCTATMSADFFSHRGSRGADGRMVAWLGILP